MLIQRCPVSSRARSVAFTTRAGSTPRGVVVRARRWSSGLCNWKLAGDTGHEPTWDPALARLAEILLAELEAAAAADIAAVTADGVRFVANAYRRIGAGCVHAGHSRFEEGSEHFLAYAYEHATGAHPVHGEIIAFAVCALAYLQGDDAPCPDPCARWHQACQPQVRA